MISINLHNFRDYQKTVNWFKSEALKEAYGISFQINAIKHQKWLKRQKLVKVFSIFYNRRYVGNITLIVRSKRLIELQIFIGDEKLHKKGIGKLAIRSILLSTPKTVTIYVRCKANLRRFYQRSGFVESASFLKLHRRSSDDYLYLFNKGRRNG